MSQFDISKNPPWLTQGQSVAVTPVQPQMLTQMASTGATIIQYPQAQIYQQPQMSQLQQPSLSVQPLAAMMVPPQMSTSSLPPGVASGVISQPPQLYSQVATVSYPTRASGGNVSDSLGSTSSLPAIANQGDKRVFTGSITKVQDNFGFIENDVFFQISCCQGIPRVGDKALVEATYNSNMPFKWNATSVKILPPEASVNLLPPGSGKHRRFSSTPQTSFVEPGSENISLEDLRKGEGNREIMRRRRFNRKRRRMDRQRELRERDKPDGEAGILEKDKERPKSPRKVIKIFKPRKPVFVTRAMGRVVLDMPEADVLELKKRYNNMYIPSDFVVSSFKWVETFPPHKSFTLYRPSTFHVMHKEVDPVITNDASIDPPDADYSFSAKVILPSVPEMSEVYQKCCALAESKDSTSNNFHEDYKDYIHPACLINFLVGLKGKNEMMAIGGAWSPSLDGPNPEKDPKILIKTAIRTCKALTGIDLKKCTQWYRFVEIYYHRAEADVKGKKVAARVETVVIYLPNIWNCVPTRLEWDGLHHNYKKKMDQVRKQKEEAEGDKGAAPIPKKEPTYYSKLDPKNMKLNELREELEARNLPSKGMTSQLIARLIKALKSEQEKEEQENASKTDAERAAAVVAKLKEEARKKKEEEDRIKKIEEEKELFVQRYTLPEKPQIVVHPSRTAKSGKFDCTVTSLAAMLDYKAENQKEHSFEVFLFAELFNEMLMRDFGFQIYKALVEAPEKTKEEKEDRSKKSKKKKDEDINSNDEKSDTEKDDDKTSEKKLKEHVQQVTVNPHLLLSFVYFDSKLQGHLYDKDVEDLCYSLGIGLSRAQVKKLVQKVESRGSIYYRKLTDRPANEPNPATNQNGTQSSQDLVTLGQGNKRHLPIFQEISVPCKRIKKGPLDKTQKKDLQSGCIKYKGSVLNIGKLQADFRLSENSRLKSENVLDQLQSENAKLKDTSHRAEAAIKKLSGELDDFRERLSNTSTELVTAEDKISWYSSLVHDIYEKLTPVFKSKIEIDLGNVEEAEVKEEAVAEEVTNTENLDIKRDNNLKSVF